jgi:hypothetical protein
MNSHEKKSTPRGPSWKKLQSPGDCNRLLRKLILDTLADRMDIRKANCMGQLALILLRSLELSTLADRIADIEKVLNDTEEHGHGAEHTPTHH